MYGYVASVWLASLTSKSSHEISRGIELHWVFSSGSLTIHYLFQGFGKPSHQVTKSLLTDPRWAWHWHLNPPLQPLLTATGSPTIHPTDPSVRYPNPLVALMGTDIPKCRLHVPSFSGVKNALEKCNFACLMLQIHW